MRTNFALPLLLLATAAFLFPGQTSAQDVSMSTASPAVEIEAASATAAIESTIPAEDEAADPAIASETVSVIIEPFANTSLTEIKSLLSTIEELYTRTRAYQNHARALIAAESDDRVFRRNCEFLLRETDLKALSAYCALAMFPRLLSIACVIEQALVEKNMLKISSDISMSAGAIDTLTAEMLAQLNLNVKLKQTMRKVEQAINTWQQSSARLSNNRHIASELPNFLKLSNKELLLLLEQQNKAFSGMLNQLDHHQDFSRRYLEHLQEISKKSHKSSITTRLSHILRSCRDFQVMQHNYRESLLNSTRRITELVEKRQVELDNLINHHSRNQAHIESFLGAFPQRDIDPEHEAVFTADHELQTALDILTKMAAQPESAQSATDKAQNNAGNFSRKELEVMFIKYINGNEWEIMEKNDDL